MEDNRTSPDLFGALLNDPQLIERVAQIVAQTKTGGSADQGASAPPGGGSTDGAQPATSPGLSSEDEGSQDTPPRSDTAGADSPQKGNSASPPHPGSAPASAHGSDSDRLSGLTSLLSDSDFMAKLPGVLSMLAPAKGTDTPKKSHVDCDRRIALLSALKPYMSPRRCEAIDYLIRINRMGDLIRRVR